MLSEKQQLQIITEAVAKAIDTGKLKIEQPQIQQIIQEPKQNENVIYEGGRVTFFDLLACIMFTLNLLGVTDINWLLVFLPFAFPYIVFYGMLWSVMLWSKIKNKNNKKEDGESKAN